MMPRRRLVLPAFVAFASFTYGVLFWHGQQSFYDSYLSNDEPWEEEEGTLVNAVVVVAQVPPQYPSDHPPPFAKMQQRRKAMMVMAMKNTQQLGFHEKLDTFKQIRGGGGGGAGVRGGMKNRQGGRAGARMGLNNNNNNQRMMQNPNQMAIRKKIILIPGDNRPPFHDIVDEDGNITGNTENLLHFAVIGFGKCGTTSMISWLDQHEELQTFPLEIYDLIHGRIDQFIRKLYTMPVGHYKRGYKSPADLTNPAAVQNIVRYFPKTRLIVGIRHPVLWFESLYNFRIQNLNAHQDHSAFPRPNDLIGSCTKDRKNTCTWKGEFGLHLRNLGKTLSTHNHPQTTVIKNTNTTTNTTSSSSSSIVVVPRYEMTELEERMYATARMKKIPDIQQIVPNPVFLFEIQQLQDNSTVRTMQFRKDVGSFLGLNTPLPDMVHKKPGRKWDQHGQHVQETKDAHKINICDDQYIRVRKELMRMARTSSVWIRNYFLDPRILADPSLRVHVSSPDYLRTLLEGWMQDPCENNREATMKAGRFVLRGIEDQDGDADVDGNDENNDKLEEEVEAAW